MSCLCVCCHVFACVDELSGFVTQGLRGSERLRGVARRGPLVLLRWGSGLSLRLAHLGLLVLLRWLVIARRVVMCPLGFERSEWLSLELSRPWIISVSLLDVHFWQSHFLSVIYHISCFSVRHVRHCAVSAFSFVFHCMHDWSSCSRCFGTVSLFELHAWILESLEFAAFFRNVFSLLLPCDCLGSINPSCGA